jgi:CBS domain-containing protein
MTHGNRVPILTRQVLVRDAMHVGILSCDRDTPLRALAREMAERGVYAVAVVGNERIWGMISAVDIAAAIASGIEQSAGEASATWVVTVSADDRLDRAARLMAEHALGHLIVIEPATGHPIGILSALDVAAIYGGDSVGDAPSPPREPTPRPRLRARLRRLTSEHRWLPSGVSGDAVPSTA